MSLDRNLFTLLLRSHPPASPEQDVFLVDLVDPGGTLYYRKHRRAGGEYKAELYDPLSGALLAGVTATSKHKTIELYNPMQVVSMRSTSWLSFCWSFEWEEHQFEWHRGECFMLRKPDPPVLVAVTDPPGRVKAASVQLLHYNLDRFDIKDCKGLEIVILFSLLTFQDAGDVYPEPRASGGASGSSAGPVTARSTQAPLARGAEGIAELQMWQGRGHSETNEVGVEVAGAVDDYAAYCAQLLQDETLLYISVCAVDRAQVHKVRQVVDKTTSLWLRAGRGELHKYEQFSEDEKSSATGAGGGPRVDDVPVGHAGKEVYSPPRSLTVLLSKIEMPELRAQVGGGKARKTSQKRLRGVRSQMFARPPSPGHASSGRLPTLGHPEPGTMSARVQRLFGLG